MSTALLVAKKANLVMHELYCLVWSNLASHTPGVSLLSKSLCPFLEIPDYAMSLNSMCLLDDTLKML